MTPDIRNQIGEIYDAAVANYRLGDFDHNSKVADSLVRFLVDNTEHPADPEEYWRIRLAWLETKPLTTSGKLRYNRVWEDPSIPDVLVAEMTLREFMSVSKFSFDPNKAESWERFKSIFGYVIENAVDVAGA